MYTEHVDRIGLYVFFKMLQEFDVYKYLLHLFSLCRFTSSQEAECGAVCDHLGQQRRSSHRGR